MIAKTDLHSTVTVTGDKIIDDSYPIVATDEEFKYFFQHKTNQSQLIKIIFEKKDEKSRISHSLVYTQLLIAAFMLNG